MSKKIVVFMGLLIIIVNNIIGHFAAPFSIFASPFIIPIVIGGINATLYKWNYAIGVIYGCLLVLTNDILIRLFAGGTHDQVGKAVISIFFIVTMVPVVFVMGCYAFGIEEKGRKKLIADISFLFFTLLITSLVYTSFIAGL